MNLSVFCCILYVNLVEQILALKNPCHTERSEVSQENRDISAFAKPQYDKGTNPQAVLFNLPNTKNTKKSKQSKGIDCHDSANAKSRNDDTSKLEQEIDKLVYSLYDLNESEIKLIEK